jgi:hypothetical protein
MSDELLLRWNEGADEAEDRRKAKQSVPTDPA